MSYERMVADEGRLRDEIAELLARAEQQDAEDDERLGAGEPELDVPDELRRRTVRLERIQAAKAALEQEAREARAAQLREQAARARQAAAQATEESVRERALTRAAARESAAENLEPGAPVATSRADDLPTHAPKVTRAGLPHAKAQRNFTDSDSPPGRAISWSAAASSCRGTTATRPWTVTRRSSWPKAPRTSHQTPTTWCRCSSACARRRVRSRRWRPPTPGSGRPATPLGPPDRVQEQGVDAYISTQRQRHGVAASNEAEEPPDEPALTPQQRMRRKVASPEGQKIYRRRKSIPEPVFGQIKQGMGFRRFSMRGMAKAGGEWSLVCTCHNLRKLWRAQVSFGG